MSQPLHPSQRCFHFNLFLECLPLLHCGWYGSGFARSGAIEMMFGGLWFLFGDLLGFLVWVLVDMGCGGSKVDDLPLVIHCRERRDLIKSALEQRFALASAHVSYFPSLKEVGDALSRFVEEEFIVGGSTPPDSPVLTLPSEGKGKHIWSKNGSRHHGFNTSPSSPLSVSHLGSSPSDHHHSHLGDAEDDEEAFHLHAHLNLSSGSDSEDSSSSSFGHLHSGEGHIHTGEGYIGHIHTKEGQAHTREGHIHSGEGHIHSGEGHTHSGNGHIHSGEGHILSGQGHTHSGNGHTHSGNGHIHSGEGHIHSGEGHIHSGEGHIHSGEGHIHFGDVNNAEIGDQSNYYPPHHGWTYNHTYNQNAYYMRKSATPLPSVYYEEPQPSSVQWGESSSNPYSNYPQYGSRGLFGFSMGSPHQRDAYRNQQASPPSPKEPPAPPSPNVSAWDFLNPFDAYDNVYGGYDSRYRYASMSSSPDSNEVREREGIPALEDETAQQPVKQVQKENAIYNDEGSQGSGMSTSRALPENKVSGQSSSRGVPVSRSSGENTARAAPISRSSVETSRAVPVSKHSGQGISKSVPVSKHSGKGTLKSVPVSKHSGQGTLKSVPLSKHSGQGTSRAVPLQDSNHGHLESSSDTDDEIQSVASDTKVSKNTKDGGVVNKEGATKIEEASVHHIDSSDLSSITKFTAHGTRDLQEAVREIKKEFDTASGFGKDVSVLLEVGKLQYQPRPNLQKVISRIMYLVAPMSSSHIQSTETGLSASSRIKMAKAYSEDRGRANVEPYSLSSTLEKLYVWEKKLYREVKYEEKLRIDYEKKCKRLKYLDARGADPSKIDATQTSIKKLLTKINVHIRTIDAISRRIHKLRDEELQPQLSELINGWTRMWRLMLKCHQKQYQAIMESKLRTLRARTGLNNDSSVRATIDLEMELLKWSSRFRDWLDTQKSYVESLNGWLVRCLLQEPEETSDGPAPFSPCRAGAPLVFVICNDWCQAMERFAESGVAETIQEFARNLHQLLERQGVEQNQRLKAEYLSKDIEKQVKTFRMERARMNETHEPIVHTGNGISKHDDLTVDLDLMKKRLEEEKARHADAIKSVNQAASSSIQAGLVPIFEALAKFTSEALKAHEQVRLQKGEKES